MQYEKQYDFANLCIISKVYIFHFAVLKIPYTLPFGFLNIEHTFAIAGRGSVCIYPSISQI